MSLSQDGRAIGVVLSTGGAGFVGSWVVSALLARSDLKQLVVLDNLSNGRREHVPNDPRVRFVAVDLRDAGAVRAAVREARPRDVIHLAALHFIPYCNAHPAETLSVNVVGMQNLLEALREHPPETLVAASTAAVYPICDEACREDLAAEPTDIYGLSKLTNERQLALFAEQTPTRCAVARLFNVYGPNETNPHVIPEILEQVLAGRTSIELGNVKPKRDYVYAADVAEALVSLLERNKAPFRTYNVGTGSEYSVEEIVAELSRVSDRPIEIAVDPSRIRRADRMHLLCDRERIGREIGWAPRHDLRSGLRELWTSAAGQSAVARVGRD